MDKNYSNRAKIFVTVIIVIAWFFFMHEAIPVAAAAPNLIITAFTVPDGSGQLTVPVTFTIKNDSAEWAIGGPNIEIGIKINATTMVCYVRDRRMFSGVLAPGQSVTLGMTSPRLPNVPGLYTAALMVDSSCEVGESNEADNVATDEYEVLAPNLVITDFTIPTGSPGALVTGSFTYTNAGSGVAVGGPNFEVALLNGLPPYSCATGENTRWIQGPMWPGEIRTIYFSLTLPPAPGSYSLGAMLDSDCQVAESEEVNNPFTMTYSVLDFNIIASNVTVRREESGTSLVTVTSIGGVTEPVLLTVTSQHPGIALTFADTGLSNTICVNIATPCIKTLDIAVDGTVPVQPYPIPIDGVTIFTSAPIAKSANFTLNVLWSLLSFNSCVSQDPDFASPNPRAGSSVLWNAFAAGGDANYTFEWQKTGGGPDPDAFVCASQPSPTCAAFLFPYLTDGDRFAEVNIRSGDGQATGFQTSPSCKVRIAGGILGFTANPSTIFPSVPSELRWQTVGMATCELRNDQGVTIPSVPLNCNPPSCANSIDTVTVLTTTTYTLDCTDADGIHEVRNAAITFRLLPDVYEKGQ